MANNQKYLERRVNSLPTSNLFPGDRYYLNVGANKYQTYIVSDSLQLTKEAGADFIECDTMAQMRALDSRQIWALQNGHYKGVRLNGYYAKGDTPAPIEYYLSGTSESVDGGSVVEVLGVKLEHVFINTVDVSYFGAKENQETLSELVNCEEYCHNNGLKLDFGSKTYIINNTLNIRCECIESGGTLEVQGNPLEAVTINKNSGVSFSKEFRLPNIINISKPAIGYEGVNTGVKTFDLNSCRVFTKDIVDFNDGFFKSASENTGNSYNTIFLGHHRNNKHNVTVWPENPGGWCNQNYFVGGRLSKLSHEMGTGGVIRIDVVDRGVGYTNATVNFTGGGNGSGASATAEIVNGEVTSVVLDNPGSGYNRTLTGSITGDGSGASIRVVIGEPGSTQIRLIENNTGSAGGVDNIHFTNTSIEGSNVDRHLWCEGRDNLFTHCRWETPNSRANAHFARRSNSTTGGAENEINLGYGIQNIYVTQEGGGTRWNTVNRGSRGTNVESFNQHLRLRSSNGTSVMRVYHSLGNFMNRGITSQADTSWALDVGYFGVRGKRQADINDRVFLDSQEGRLYLGSGTTENIPSISSGGGSPEGVVRAAVGSIYMNIFGSGSIDSNIWQKTSNPNGNTGWKLLTQQPTAGPTTRGLVVQSPSVSNSVAPLPTGDSSSTADTLEDLLIDHNDLVAKYNSLLTVVSELQEKLNAKLTADRNSGQQAT